MTGPEICMAIPEHALLVGYKSLQGLCFKKPSQDSEVEAGRLGNLPPSHLLLLSHAFLPICTLNRESNS